MDVAEQNLEETSREVFAGYLAFLLDTHDSDRRERTTWWVILRIFCVVKRPRVFCFFAEQQRLYSSFETWERNLRLSF